MHAMFTILMIYHDNVMCCLDNGAALVAEWDKLLLRIQSY